MTDKNQPTAIRGFEAALPIALLRARSATAHKFKPHTDAAGLTQPQWRIMRALAPGTPLDSRTLALRCALLPPSVSRIVRVLLDRGLIQRHDAPDGRSQRLSLTSEGRALFDKVALLSEAVYRDIENAFGRERLLELLNHLHALTELCETLPDLPLPETPSALEETQE
ncbi:MarR family transcriptional regulator [Paracoccus sp. (in: a-proteobacteria)]|uniref:MarR family transcriptional regulator n=1 Tax=Paracoccus sp. TaxID=267 RepID=UPI003A87C307